MALALLGDHRRGGPGRSARGSCARPLERSGSTIGPPCSGFALCARSFQARRGLPLGAEGRIVGIDPAPPRVQLALQRGDQRLEFRIGQAQDLSPFGDATFDVAYMNSVLNWIDDRPKAFVEANRVLKPRGRLGVATTVRDRPNQLRLLAHRAERIATGRAADTATDNSLSEQCGSKYAATAAEIRDMLEDAGLAVQTLDVRSSTSVFRDVGQIIAFCGRRPTGACSRRQRCRLRRLSPGNGNVAGRRICALRE